jgi:hypothetical protein
LELFGILLLFSLSLSSQNKLEMKAKKVEKAEIDILTFERAFLAFCFNIRNLALIYDLSLSLVISLFLDVSQS